jgi:hypothetical protein
VIKETSTRSRMFAWIFQHWSSRVISFPCRLKMDASNR